MKTSQKKDQKVQIDFNQLQYEKTVEQLNNAAAIYNKALLCFEKITGKREIQQMDLLESYITAKTGFKNVPMSATLLEVNNEYFFLNDYLNKLQPEVLDVVAGTAVVKKEMIDLAKESATIYLQEKLVADYLLLEEAAKLLNQLSNPTHSKFLVANFEGKFSIKAIPFNNSTR